MVVNALPSASLEKFSNNFSPIWLNVFRFSLKFHNSFFKLSVATTALHCYSQRNYAATVHIRHTFIALLSSHSLSEPAGHSFLIPATQVNHASATRSSDRTVVEFILTSRYQPHSRNLFESIPNTIRIFIRNSLVSANNGILDLVQSNISSLIDR